MVDAVAIAILSLPPLLLSFAVVLCAGIELKQSITASKHAEAAVAVGRQQQ